MEITTKLGYRNTLRSEMASSELIYTLTNMIQSLQAEANRMGVEVDWSQIRIETQDVETRSFMESGRGIVIQVYGRKA